MGKEDVPGRSCAITAALLAWLEFRNQDFSSCFTLQKETVETALFLLLFNTDYVASGFSCWGCIINMVLQEIVRVHSLKITSLNSHCGFGDLFPGAGSQIFQNTHRIIGFHWVCWQTTSSAHSPQPTEAMGDSTIQALGGGEDQCPPVCWRGWEHDRQDAKLALTMLGKRGNEIQ